MQPSAEVGHEQGVRCPVAEQEQAAGDGDRADRWLVLDLAAACFDVVGGYAPPAPGVWATSGGATGVYGEQEQR